MQNSHPGKVHKSYGKTFPQLQHLPLCFCSLPFIVSSHFTSPCCHQESSKDLLPLLSPHSPDPKLVGTKSSSSARPIAAGTPFGLVSHSVQLMLPLSLYGRPRVTFHRSSCIIRQNTFVWHNLITYLVLWYFFQFVLAHFLVT